MNVFFSKNGHCDLEFGSSTNIQTQTCLRYDYTTHLCAVKSNRSINEGARVMPVFFLKKANVTLTLVPQC